MLDFPKPSDQSNGKAERERENILLSTNSLCSDPRLWGYHT